MIFKSASITYKMRIMPDQKPTHWAPGGYGLLSSGHYGNCNLLGLQGFKGGRMTLVFGCRHPEEDHIYQEEMQEMVRKGVLYQVHTGYSRLPGKSKVSAATQQAGRVCMMATARAIHPFLSKPLPPLFHSEDSCSVREIWVPRSSGTRAVPGWLYA